jgi:UDP-N-acetylglucosamine 4-epimerase
MDRYDEVCGELRESPRRFLLTGAAGFIGSNLLERLLKLDQHVVGVDDFSTGHQENLSDVLSRVGPEQAQRFRFVRGDLGDPEVCRAAVRGADVVLHQAALGSVPRSVEDPARSHRSNVDAWVELLVACREVGIQRVVYASSSSVYGDDESGHKREHCLGRPLSPYAATKLCDEIYADVFNRTYGMECIGLRYFNVFGPRQDPNGAYAAVIPAWTLRCLRGQACILYGDGAKSRDFCYVDNVVRANLLAARASDEAVQGQIYNIACGARTTLEELFENIQRRAALLSAGASEVVLERHPPRAGDIAHSLADIDKARRLLGYSPSWDVERGLDETVGWFAARERSSRAPIRAA